MKKELTLGSLFDGSGGFPLAGQLCGIKPIGASEIEPFPIKCTTKRFPDMKHYGNVCDIHGDQIEPVDIITFGSPCFPQDTMVLTDKGYKPIQEIRVGENVYTHKGRLRKVLRIGHRKSDTIILKGNHYGLETTSNHPIYTYTDKDNAEWVEAGLMKGKMWATPRKLESIGFAIPDNNKREKPFPKINKDFFYFCGRWLGDGGVRDSQRCDRPKGQRFGTIYLCGAKDEEKELTDIVKKISNNYSVEYDTCIKVRFNSNVLCRGLVSNFNKGAGKKKIPAWVYGLHYRYRKAFFQGLIDSDGYKLKNNSWRYTTISKALALGIRTLGETLGYTTTIYYTKVKPKKVIGERVVRQNNYYVVQFTKNRKKVIRNDLHGIYKCKEIIDGQENVVVYNLEVQDDNSYIADSIVVHNCQDLSLAGKRAGLGGSRSNLFFQALRIIKEMRGATNGKYPRYAVWENVAGAFTSNKGADFLSVIRGLGDCAETGISIPGLDKGCEAGCVMADNFSLAWRTLNAQFWGVPQRRRRIYLVADFTGQSAKEILFKCESVSRYYQSVQKAGKDFAKGVGSCADKTGEYYGWHGQTCDAIKRDVADTCMAGYGEGGCNKSMIVDKQGADLYNQQITGKTSATLSTKSCHNENCVIEKKVYENHSQDARYKEYGDTCNTIASNMGMGGNNQDLVVENEKSVYDIRQTSDGTKNARHNVYKTDTSRTLDTSGTDPTGNYGGCAVIEKSQGIDSHTGNVYDETSHTLKAEQGGGSSPKVSQNNIVRRITPTECARLQGFPDGWCDDLEIKEPTQAQMEFGHNVFDTWDTINGKKANKSDNQIKKWLANRHTDSAEYKMGGNGIALPCALRVLSGIVEENEQTDSNDTQSDTNTTPEGSNSPGDGQ